MGHECLHKMSKSFHTNVTVTVEEKVIGLGESLGFISWGPWWKNVDQSNTAVPGASLIPSLSIIFAAGLLPSSHHEDYLLTERNNKNIGWMWQGLNTCLKEKYASFYFLSETSWSTHLGQRGSSVTLTMTLTSCDVQERGKRLWTC